MSDFAIGDLGSSGRPFWSVMIPLYRPDLAMLRQTIASISAASSGAEAMQVALVQDGATGDEDSELARFLAQCRDQGLEVFTPVGRLGIGGNWNRCVTLARGHVIHILHQDDRVRPGFYGAHQAAFRTAPEIGASFTQHAFISAAGAVLREGQWHGDAAGVLDDWHEHVVANLAIQCPAIVVRRSVYEQLGGFDESYRYCLDRAMWQRIAALYPLWYDPRTLAEYRVHDANQTSALSVSILPWRETLRCINEGLKLVPPTARVATERRARYVVMRLAFQAALDAGRQGRLRPAIASLGGLVSVARPYDYASILAGISHQAPSARAPVVDPANPHRRRRRVTLITEFFPYDPGRSVFGVFSRLRHLLEGLEQVGVVDIVFFRPTGREANPSEQIAWERQVRSIWPISGQVRFARAARRWSLLDTTSDAVWGLRGALSFLQPRPSMETTGRAPVRSLQRVLSQLQPDLIVAHRISTAAALWRIGRPMPPIVVDVDDLDHVKLARMADSQPKWTDRLVTRFWAALARRAIRGVSTIAARMLVSSELDRTKLLALCPLSSISVIPNTAQTFPAARAAQSTGPVALFVGTFDYPPNREGVEWLLAEVWPMVRESVPDARLLVVGAGAENLAATAVDGIEVLGFVEDLGPIYQAARVAVCPIHRGAGTRIKVIEAAMNGRPTVSTSVGAEGLLFSPGSEIVLADGAARFAEACINLLHDPQLARRIGDAARQQAAAVYDPEIVATRLAATCLDAIGEAADGSPHRAPADRAAL